MKLKPVGKLYKDVEEMMFQDFCCMLLEVVEEKLCDTKLPNEVKFSVMDCSLNMVEFTAEWRVNHCKYMIDGIFYHDNMSMRLNVYQQKSML